MLQGLTIATNIIRNWIFDLSFKDLHLTMIFHQIIGHSFPSIIPVLFYSRVLLPASRTFHHFVTRLSAQLSVHFNTILIINSFNNLPGFFVLSTLDYLQQIPAYIIIIFTVELFSQCTRQLRPGDQSALILCPLQSV